MNTNTAGKLLFTACLFLSGALFANGTDNLTNASPEYIRTLSRNAACDSADAVFYNPAGVVKLEDGFYISAGSQTILKSYKTGLESESLGLSEDYESNKMTPTLPDVYLLYKNNKWAAFGAFNIVGGGGGLEYSDGLPMMKLLAMKGLGDKKTVSLPIYGTQTLTVTDVEVDEMKLEGSSMYMQGMIGGAYAVNDMFSFALAGRYVNARKEYSGNMSYTATLNGYDATYGNINKNVEQTVEFDTKSTASGIGFVVGLDFALLDNNLIIALKYTSPVALEFENDTKVDGTGLFPDKAKKRRDLPGYISAGIGYNITPKINVSTSFDYFMETMADWEGAEKDVEDTYQIGAGVVYSLLPRLKLSTGVLYVGVRTTDEYMSDLDYPLTSVTVGFGAMYEVIDNLNLNLGISKGFYSTYTEKLSAAEAPATDVEQSYAKSIMNVAVGVQYKL